MDGKRYRVRVETLIYNKQGKILAAKRGKETNMGAMYKIPGGSVEPGKSLEAQAIAESQEEARVNVKHINNTGIWYKNEFLDDISDRDEEQGNWLKKVGLNYDGFITILFVGEYGGKFTGRVKKEDQVDWTKQLEFYDAKELDLLEVHKMSLKHIWLNMEKIG
jgi:ADP-ribose pyrophosphatase YjhB (NUDIX family)